MERDERILESRYEMNKSVLERVVGDEDEDDGDDIRTI